MILIYSSTTGTGELGVLFFLSLIINYYLDLNYVLESRSLLLIRVLLMGARCSFIYFTFFSSSICFGNIDFHCDHCDPRT